MREAMIWVTGLVAGAVVGGLIGFQLARYGGGQVWGALGGACAFACLRLWRMPKS